MTSQTPHLLSDMPTLSRSTSTTPSASGHRREDIAVARVLAKRLISAGQRKGPPDFLLLPDSAVEAWLDQEAIRLLEENGQQKQSGKKVVYGGDKDRSGVT